MAVTIKGGEKLQAKLHELQRKVGKSIRTRVGYLEGADYPDGTPVAQVAFWNEFGKRTAPPRPFMRTAVAENEAQWGDALGKALVATGYDADKAMNVMGQLIASQIRDQITKTESPANAPLTNLLKDRFPTGDYTTEDFLQAVKDLKEGVGAPAGKPLVWSGRMLQDTTYEVKDGVSDD